MQNCLAPGGTTSLPSTTRSFSLSLPPFFYFFLNFFKFLFIGGVVCMFVQVYFLTCIMTWLVINGEVPIRVLQHFTHKASMTCRNPEAHVHRADSVIGLWTLKLSLNSLHPTCPMYAFNKVSVWSMAGLKLYVYRLSRSLPAPFGVRPSCHVVTLPSGLSAPKTKILIRALVQ